MTISNSIFSELPVSDYDAVRSQIRNGDLLFCSGKHPFSELIKAATDSIWSHVAIVLRLDSIDRIMVLESVESAGVRAVPLSSYVNNYQGSGKGYKGRVLVARHGGFAEVGGTKAAMLTLTQNAVDLFGYPYDRDEIAKIAARIAIGGFTLGKVPKPLQRDREYICSEYVEECLKSIGINIASHPRGYVSPQEFALDPQVTARFVLR